MVADILAWIGDIPVAWWALLVAAISALFSILTFMRNRPGRVHWEVTWQPVMGPTTAMLTIRNVGVPDAHDVQLAWIPPDNPHPFPGGWEVIHVQDDWPFLERYVDVFRPDAEFRVRLQWREAPRTKRLRRKDLSWHFPRELMPTGDEVLRPEFWKAREDKYYYLPGKGTGKAPPGVGK